MREKQKRRDMMNKVYDLISSLPFINDSRETILLLDCYVKELLHWQKTQNLISPHTISDVWTRHIVDSLQICTLKSFEDNVWLDMGTGAGLPGLVIAIALRSQSTFHMHLVESHKRKCSFLQAITTQLKLPVTIHSDRIEKVLPQFKHAPDVITARALCSLKTLLDYVDLCRCKPKKLLFMKGKTVQDEILEAKKHWGFAYEMISSQTDADGCIVSISDFCRLSSKCSVHRM
jgi:16S rRNA (guanine527-N7)-methyltransferase